MKKWKYIVAGICLSCMPLALSFPSHAEEGVVVCIDPGHGGDNLGAQWNDYTEKEMTLIVAKAMKEQLEKYEDVTVYLTREDDKSLSLEERAEYAASVQADFLFCLHFNMSEAHTLFGSEVWISSVGELYSKGHAFGDIELDALEEKGLLNRGVKTKLNEAGEEYYGILRHSVERNLPVALIEHCHLDREEDVSVYDANEKLKALGELDGESAAKYFRLRSDVLGTDYSSYEVPKTAVPQSAIGQDTTPPDICSLSLMDQDKTNGETTFEVSAADYDSKIIYYSYSYDGGATFSELKPWPEGDTFRFTITIPSGILPQVVVAAYNNYDLFTNSNMVSTPSLSYAEDTGMTEHETIQETAETQDVLVISTVPDKSKNNNDNVKQSTFLYFLEVCLVAVLILFVLFLLTLLILTEQKRKHRRKR
ncbi:MAG: N-acetylmuramoyl-L-alanine amidase [Lachnospiraceae bacterium]|nr:N-acetylmuramoyl-L-alanine amidase [Lachnospiraceae bacterium]